MITILLILFLIAGLQRILPKFSVERSVTTSMLFIGIILIGGISLIRLPQELFPPITYPQLTVATSYANAAPEEIETLITKTIEEAISTVKNIKEIRSTSKEGLSLVIADFHWGTDMNIAALNMREKIDLVKESLPRDAEEPIVLKYNPYDRPILILSVTGKQRPEELLQISRKIIKDKLEKIEGVASAGITGGKEREIMVDIDQAQLKGSHTDLLKVVDALKNSNLNYPAGTTKEKFYEYLIRTMGEFEKISDIGNVPISLYDIAEEDKKEKSEGKSKRERERSIIHKKRMFLLKDVADIKDTFKEPTSYSRYNGKANISIAIQKQADANTIQTAKKIRTELERLKETSLPNGVKIEIVYDQSIYIKDSITGVASAAWQGGLLAFIVLLVFLRKLGSASVVTLSIPISIFATFGLMYFQGFSINMMSLGGLALGVGMLVDNAIVAVENIYRYRELGTAKKESSVKGAIQVAGPIVASTLTTVAVFLPMAFLVGVAGQIFRDLAFTIAFSLTASMFVALSLIPMLTSQGRDKKPTIPKKSKKSFDFITPLIKIDEKIVKLFMRFKYTGLLVIFILFLISLGLLNTVEKELMPKVDTGQFNLKITLLTGTKLDVTNKTTKRIEDYLFIQDEIDSITTIVGSPRRSSTESGFDTLGSHQAQVVINLKAQRNVSTQEFVQRIKEGISDMNLTSAEIDYIMQESQISAGGGTSAPIIVKVNGLKIDKLNNLAKKVYLEMSSIKGLYGIKTTIARPSPETKIRVNKDKASLYSLNVRDIAQTALISIKGLVATKFKEEGNEYDITVRLDPKYKKDLTGLQGIEILSSQGFAVPLNEVAALSKGKGPSRIERFDQQKVIFVNANIFGESLSTVSEKVEKIIEEMEIEEGYSVDLVGETEEAKKSFANLLFILFLSITLVYMIMASQFESTWQPFIIMFTVPFSIIGVAPALLITGTSLNIITILGVIILGGIVVNNGIVLIEYINEMRAEGKSIVDSAIEASKTRLRPIIMTALTTVLGLTPMAIARGSGAELRAPLAITVMGGLILATTLTLWVIPVLYVIAAGWIEKFKKK